MIDERTLQAAAGALEKNWLNRATDKELDLLVAAGHRPELFEKPDEDTISVVLHPVIAAEPIIVRNGSTGNDAETRLESLSIPFSGVTPREDRLGEVEVASEELCADSAGREPGSCSPAPSLPVA